jgi:hypothetical protein
MTFLLIFNRINISPVMEPIATISQRSSQLLGEAVITVRRAPGKLTGENLNIVPASS